MQIEHICQSLTFLCKLVKLGNKLLLDTNINMKMKKKIIYIIVSLLGRLDTYSGFCFQPLRVLSSLSYAHPQIDINMTVPLWWQVVKPFCYKYEDFDKRIIDCVFKCIKVIVFILIFYHNRCIEFPKWWSVLSDSNLLIIHLYIKFTKIINECLFSFLKWNNR